MMSHANPLEEVVVDAFLEGKTRGHIVRPGNANETLIQVRGGLTFRDDVSFILDGLRSAARAQRSRFMSS